MSISINKLVLYSFIIGFITASMGAVLKIMHLGFSEPILAASVLLNVVFVACAIYEVRSSSQFTFREKTMWTIALLFFPGFSGIVYILLGRRKLAR